MVEESRPRRRGPPPARSLNLFAIQEVPDEEPDVHPSLIADGCPDPSVASPRCSATGP